QAVVDASTIWLLDANGDFVFDTNPANNWSSGSTNLPQLTWQHVPGAVKYHLFARNTTSAGANSGPALQWREVTITQPSLDPNVAIDQASLPAPFTAAVERGSTFVKTIRVDFSEPMSALSPLVLASGSANITVVKQNALAFGTATGPASPPGNTGSSAFVNLS